MGTGNTAKSFKISFADIMHDPLLSNLQNHEESRYLDQLLDHKKNSNEKYWFAKELEYSRFTYGCGAVRLHCTLI